MTEITIGQLTFRGSLHLLSCNRGSDCISIKQLCLKFSYRSSMTFDVWWEAVFFRNFTSLVHVLHSIQIHELPTLKINFRTDPCITGNFIFVSPTELNKTLGHARFEGAVCRFFNYHPGRLVKRECRLTWIAIKYLFFLKERVPTDAIAMSLFKLDFWIRSHPVETV